MANQEDGKVAPPRAAISEDRKATEYLANERTFLAWVRTSIAVISLGFVIAKFSLWLHEFALRLDPHAEPTRAGASLPIGISMMVLGGVLAGLAARRYYVVNRDIDRGRVYADHSLIILVTAMMGLLSVAMIVYMVLTAGRL